MPAYKYTCKNNHSEILLRKVENRDDPVTCSICGEPMVRDFNNLGVDIQFRAMGFYATRHLDAITEDK
ncbi:MAG: hypothetical protein QXV17_04970 [Candidatus Micrarchaeaceae archaeon]